MAGTGLDVEVQDGKERGGQSCRYILLSRRARLGLLAIRFACCDPRSLLGRPFNFTGIFGATRHRSRSTFSPPCPSTYVSTNEYPMVTSKQRDLGRTAQPPRNDGQRNELKPDRRVTSRQIAPSAIPVPPITPAGDDFRPLALNTLMLESRIPANPRVLAGVIQAVPENLSVIPSP